MIYFSTNEDANEEKLNRPWLKIQWDFCGCGSLQGYYEEYNATTGKMDKVYACDECYVQAEPIQRK